MDPKEIVRRGYDELSHRYRGDAEEPASYATWLAQLRERVPATEDNWLGGQAPMWWSHADAATYRAWIERAGLAVVAEETVPEDAAVHALFWARRPPDPSG